MYTRMYKVTILSVAILVGALAPRSAQVQDPTDLPMDFLFKRVHEWKLQHDQARLEEDINRGDAMSVNRDLNRIQRDERRIWLDERMIRRDMWLPVGPWVPRPKPIPPGETLVAHPQYPEYGYYPSNPAQLYRLPQAAGYPGAVAASAELGVVIVNAGKPGTAVEYVVDGFVYKTESGQHQELAAGPGSTIRYQRGGELGEQRYALTAGVYEFRSVDKGWSLVKLKPAPAKDASGSPSDVVPRNELPMMTVAPKAGGSGVDRIEPQP